MIQVFTCLSQMIVIFIFISIVNCKNGWTVYEEKPSCINLNHTSGGLGNQLFSILSKYLHHLH